MAPESLTTQVVTSLRFELLFTLCAIGCWAIGSMLRRRTRASKTKSRKTFDDQVKGSSSGASRGAGGNARNQPSGFVRTKSGDVIIRRGDGPEDVIHSYETTVYRESRGAKLLQGMAPDTLQKFFVEVFSAAVATERAGRLPQYIKHAMQLEVVITQEQVESLVKMCTAKKHFKEAVAAFDLFNLDHSDAGSCTGPTWSCLLFCAVQAGQWDRCDAFYVALQKRKSPSSDDFMNMLRFVIHTRSLPRVAVLLRDLRDAGAQANNILYNRALALCVASQQLEMAEEVLTEICKLEHGCDVITYNTLIKGYAQMKNLDRCFELEKQMASQGIEPSDVTFGILLDACIGADQLEKAAQVFRQFQASGRQLNAILYTTLLKGLARAGQPDQAMQVFNQMCESGIEPDLVAFSVLIKAHCDSGRVETALELLERMCKLGLSPDEIVFNNLLLGCVERKNLQLGNLILSDMRKYIQPSNVTLSIMLKLFGACREWDKGLELLNTSTDQFGVPCEGRLYIQHAQTCIRNRQGKKVIETCEALLRKCRVDDSTLGRLMTQCVGFNMLDTGAEILDRALGCGVKINERDIEAFMAAAVKKKKVNVIRSVISVMQRHHMPVEQRWCDEAKALCT